jgi:hypothetical protein
LPRPKKHVRLNPPATEPINPRDKPKPEPPSLRKLDVRAARNGWDTPPEQQARIIDLLVGELLPRAGKPKKGKEPLTREDLVRITRTLILASLGQQKLDLNRHRDNVGGLKIDPEGIARAQQLAEERKAQRQQEADQRDRDSRGKRK